MLVALVALCFSTSALRAAALPTAGPTITPLQRRNVTSLDQAAFQEAQQRDDTATRAFSSIPIKVSKTHLLPNSLPYAFSLADPRSDIFRPMSLCG